MVSKQVEVHTKCLMGPYGTEIFVARFGGGGRLEAEFRFTLKTVNRRVLFCPPSIPPPPPTPRRDTLILDPDNTEYSACLLSRYGFKTMGHHGAWMQNMLMLNGASGYGNICGAVWGGGRLEAEFRFTLKT